MYAAALAPLPLCCPQGTVDLVLTVTVRSSVPFALDETGQAGAELGEDPLDPQVDFSATYDNRRFAGSAMTDFRTAIEVRVGGRTYQLSEGSTRPASTATPKSGSPTERHAPSAGSAPGSSSGTR